MSEIDSITDIELRASQPCALDDDFLARLMACTDGSLLELTPAEIEFEQGLRAIAPVSLPASLRGSLEKSIGDTPFHTDSKIVLFNRSKGGSSQSSISWWSHRANIAAAAAMALLGCITALYMPGGERTKTADNKAVIQNHTPVANSPTRRSITPVGYNPNLSSTNDEGVIWQGNTRPHRVMRLTFTDRFTLTNKEGQTVEVEQPRDEYVIIPEKVD